MHEIYTPRPSQQTSLDGQERNIPAPLDRPEEQKAPLLQKIMMFVVMIVMGGVIGWYIFSGGMSNFNPMMLMVVLFPLMMITSMFQTGQTNMNSAIKHWFLQLRESRKVIHMQGEAMFDALRLYFPQPEALHQLVGKDKTGVASMWTVKDGKAGISSVEPGTAREVTFNPYLSARAGLATVMLYPILTADDGVQIQDNLEPVTIMGWSKFQRTQRFVPGCPVGYDLGNRPFARIHASSAADDDVLALTRAMISSLAFNHAPGELAIALITPDPDHERWAPIKFLPHVINTKPVAGQSQRLIFSSLEEFMAASARLREGRPVGSAHGVGGAPSKPRLVVVVDTPHDVITLPRGLSAKGISGITFLFVRVADFAHEDLVSDTNTLFLDDNRHLSTATAQDLIYADAMSTVEFDKFCRRISNYRPPKFGQIEETHEAPTNDRTFFDVLGIVDVSDFDPRPGWDANEPGLSLAVPIGFEQEDDAVGRVLDKVVELNLAQVASGGTGPSGTMQGKAGTGKSVWLRTVTLGLVTKFSPTRLNLVLMDFKGGSTFLGYEHLPHVLANITNLKEESELLGRALDVIKGEIERRQRLINKVAKVTDLDEYRRKSLRDPAMEPIPDLLVIVDEFAEFITDKPEFRELFDQLARVGRSLGMHILLASQFIDVSLIGNVKENVFFGVSLQVDNASYSRSVIKSDAATKLRNNGDGYLYRDNPGPGNQELTRFHGLNPDEKYIAPPKPVSPIEAPLGLSPRTRMAQVIAAADGSAVRLFTAFTSGTDGPEQGRHSAPDEALSPAITPHIDSDTLPTMREALLDRLAQISRDRNIGRPHEMWLPTLKAPINLSDAGAGRNTNISPLAFRIGILDDPYHHQRLTYDITPEGAGAHIRVVGDRGTGRSTVGQAIIASSALAYAPGISSFYIIDAGTKMAEMTGWPNVGMYARQYDEEKIDRLLGELNRIGNLRSEMMAAREQSSFAGYFESKQNDPIPADPYGHMFLLIDDIHTFLRDDTDKVMSGRLERLCDFGSVGIHLIVLGDATTINHKIDQKFGLFIHLSVANLGDSTVNYQGYEQKQLIGSIPPGQPGRIIDLVENKAGRIVLPHFTDAVPLSTEDPNNPEWNFRQDWGPQIRELGAELSHNIPDVQRLPRVETVSPYLDPIDVLQRHSRYVEATGETRSLPMGVSALDLSLVTMHDASVGVRSPHLLIPGDRGSGRTGVLRWLMRAIATNWRPDDVQIFIFDPNFGLLAERDTLIRSGHSRSEMYAANDRESQTRLVQWLAQIIDQRMPTNPETLTAAQMRARAWWQGPEIVVIMDPVDALLGSSSYADDSVLEPLVERIGMRTDIGVRLFATANAQNFSSNVQMNKFVRSVLGTNGYTLLLSGAGIRDNIFGNPAEGTSIKFSKRRPGMGQFYNPDHVFNQPIVQVPYDPPWPDPQ